MLQGIRNRIGRLIIGNAKNIPSNNSDRSRLPVPMLVTSLPRSGSGFIRKAICNHFNVRTSTNIDYGAVYDSRIDSRYFFDEILSGKRYGKTHFAPFEYNLNLLDAYGMRKIVVHVRDPRDAAVSWFYQIRRREILEDEATVSSLLASDCVPEEISSMDDWEIKQWIVDVYFDKLIGWISSWQSVMEDDARFRILMTNFSKMKHDPSGFFSEIFHFYGFEQAFNRDALPALEKNSFKNNFREGREKEYVDFFTTEQINELNHKMALELRKSFDNE